MIYSLSEEKQFDGKTDFININDHLHELLKSKCISFLIDFETEASGYMTLFSMYYKESCLPDFAVSLYKGYITIITVHNKKKIILSSQEAYNNGLPHRLYIRGDDTGLRIYADGELIAEDKEIIPYSEFAYGYAAVIGRGIVQDEYANYFQGKLFRFDIAEEELEAGLSKRFYSKRWKKLPLFHKGMASCETYRIPTIIVTKSGTVVASADARMDCPGDNPNHIRRAIRISHDNGETFSEVKLLPDYGGIGRRNGASAIDGAMVYDEDTKQIFMIYCHTSAGVGSFVSKAGTGYSEDGQFLLWDKDNQTYYKKSDGFIYDSNGRKTEYTVDSYGTIYKGKDTAGSINHEEGQERLFRQADTCFLHLIHSEDQGENWSDPIDLTRAVKAEWMKFIGSGPGVGIQIKTGEKKGRLVFPVYYSSDVGKQYSCGTIYSDDHGRTWKRGASVNDGRLFKEKIINAREVTDPEAQVTECQIIELLDGRLKIMMRNYIGQPYVCSAISYDGGETFVEQRIETELLDPDCQSSVLSFDYEGKRYYLFSNPEHKDLRVHGVLKVSETETEAWEKKLLIEPGEYGYSCMVKLSDQTIGIAFEGKEVGIDFVKIPISEILSQ